MTRTNVTQRDLYEGMIQLRDQMDEFKIWADARFVSKEEFLPVQKVVYGLVGAVGLAVLSALFAVALGVA